MIHLPHWPHHLPNTQPSHNFDLFAPLRHWLDEMTVTNPFFARFICRVIPNSCPFERDVTLCGYTIHIPALCQLNPIYDELIALRFRALMYLSDICHEDITPYFE
ncbi:MAG: Mo-dependent nitrogenase C-terminal domain-containing protein [Cyanobacteria bacterium P01_F01_bin.86]